MKLDLPDDDVPLLIRAVEHYQAYLQATQRHDSRLQEIAELLKRKGPGSERAAEEKPAKRKA
jgi:hypothetical protein